MGQLFKKQFTTKKTKEETRIVINNIMTKMPMLKTFVQKVEWQGDNLVFSSTIGNGFFAIDDYSVSVEINLNFLGQAAAGKLEETLDEGMKQLTE
ncbi:MAG: polyhydroxyalkanoic acid system family protein [Ignavibacteria bacterium]|jgi:hypothetical protein|nr:polyhydroxyalkanoic acid system family protein [Ignavibacteria bacterium]